MAEPYYNPPLTGQDTTLGDITLRDEFAGAVLATMNTVYLLEDGRGWTPQNIANHAYNIADAMLRERAVQR